MKNGEKFARKCDATGEGMNAGFCVGDGDRYFKHEADLVADIRSRGADKENKLSDEFILSESYNLEEYYYTEWEDESEFQYVVVDGELKEIEVVSYFDLEFFDSGDGVEYEVWEHKDGQLYKIPIEIVRDFDMAEKVSSCHEAKFGK